MTPVIHDGSVKKITDVRISKSKFVAGVQCLKRLYWQVHQPELATERDAAVEAIMHQGHEVGLLAHQIFPGGVEVSGDGGLDEAIRTTRELVANTEIPAIFEGTFEHGGVLVRVDILHRRRDNRWHLIEVKANTDLKDHHLDAIILPPVVFATRNFRIPRYMDEASVLARTQHQGSTIRIPGTAPVLRFRAASQRCRTCRLRSA